MQPSTDAAPQETVTRPSRRGNLKGPATWLLYRTSDKNPVAILSMLLGGDVRIAASMLMEALGAAAQGLAASL